MKRDDIARAQCLEACIIACERNLNTYEKVKKAREIKIQINDIDKDHTPFYISGEVKDQMIDLLIEKETKILNSRLADLEKL